MSATRRWLCAALLLGAHWTFGTGCASPRSATVVRELPAVAWLADRVDELARADHLRGALPLAQVDMAAGDALLRVWLRTGPRRALIEVRGDQNGVFDGEMWVFWSAPSQAEDDAVFAEYRDRIDCVDRRSGGGLGMCRPRPRQPVDWTMVEAKLRPAWKLPDQAKFGPPGEFDGQLMVIERRKGRSGEVVHWDVGFPITTDPGVRESETADALWEAVWSVIDLAERPE